MTTPPQPHRDRRSPSPSSLLSLPPLTPLAPALYHTLFANWYPLLRRHSPKATLLDLSSLQPDFLNWLEQDGIILPRGSGHLPRSFDAATSSTAHPDGKHFSSSALNHHDDDDDEGQRQQLSDDDDEEDEDEAEQAPTFPALDEAIRDVIRRYDGAVFPKLLWSAPQDAAWILPGSSLRCTTPEDVYLVLKSSDFVAKDIEQAKELRQLLCREAAEAAPAEEEKVEEEAKPDSDTAHRGNGATSEPLSTPPAPPSPSLPQPSSNSKSKINDINTNEIPTTLALKQHFTMPKSHEFRSFVRSGTLIAISQRDITYFEHLQPPSVQHTIRTRILDFFEKVLRDTVKIQDFIFDAYLTRDLGRCFIVDLNPYLPRTDPLLFSWEEVEEVARGRVGWEGGGEGGGEEVRLSFLRRGAAKEEEGGLGQDTTPPTLSRPRSPSSSSTTSTINDADDSDDNDDEDLPPLRLITSHAQASQSFPTYSANMVPRDLIDVSNGQGIAQFAREWERQVSIATSGGGGGGEEGSEEEEEE